MSTSRFRRAQAWWRWLDARAWRAVRRYFVRAVITAALLVLPLALWGLWIEPDQLTVKTTPLAIPNWPTGFAPLKVVALSDLHVGAPHITLDKLRTVVQRTNEQKPDLIVLLGDYVIQGIIGGRFTEPGVFVEVLKDLQAPLGVYAVLGNHDWWYNDQEVTRAFERVGIRMLTNEAVQLERNGSTLWLAGLGDLFSHKDDLEKTMRSVTTADPILAITHTPDIFLQLPPQFILTLAGHTHGGQVNLPLLGRRVVPSDYGEKYAIGFVAEGEKRLFVTPGIGTSIFPVRFRVPPEISALMIRGEGR
ncbi:MAG TPA: metallophosphoesterase [Blastocatellia bacterium]|nr:metallophosphoesterase [Blastocatellia bacterium]